MIGIIASVTVLIAMLWMANPEKLVDSLRRANLYFILVVIILYFINLITKAVRWHLLVNSSGTKVPFSKIFPFYVIGLAFNNLTPAKIGGEPIRAYLLKKEADVPMGQGIASIFAEKIMDIIVITTMAVIGAIFLIPLLKPNDAKILIFTLVLLIIGIIAALVIVTHSSILKKTVDKSVNLAMKVSNRSFIKRLSMALVGFVDKFRFGMSEIINSKATAVFCSTLTVIIWINEAIRLFIIILALPNIVGVGIGVVFIASSIANIIGFAVPLGAGNILGIETVLMVYGINYNNAITVGFLQVATSIWISVPLGVVAMLITGLRIPKNSNKNSNKNSEKDSDKNTNRNSEKEPKV